MVLHTDYVSFVDQKYTKKQEVSKRVFPNIWVEIICSSFGFDGNFLSAFSKAILFRNINGNN